MKRKRGCITGLILGIVLMLAPVGITLALATPLSNDPGRTIIGNGNYWFEYYFNKTSWMLFLGACVSTVSCVMLILRKK